jgi:hypothetical protein
MPEGWGADDDDGFGGGSGNDDVDMEITFMPALSKKVGEGDETTLEKYQRKVREKRKKLKDGKGKQDEQEQRKEDEFFEASGDEDESEGGRRDEKKRDKSRREKKRNIEESSKGVEEPRKEATAAELALLVAPDKSTDEPKHFNLKSVIKAEKDKKRKGKRSKKRETEDNEAQEGFTLNVKDERFKPLFEDHQFAVDPSNPQYVFSLFFALELTCVILFSHSFKKTKAMTAILEERQRRRREQVGKIEELHDRRGDTVGSGTNSNLKSLQSLVDSVKRKSVNVDMPGVGKRRKL